MLPRDSGGVVSPELKVYGTRNVRVIDASVLPFQLCGHLTSTLYAVAERASDLIKKRYIPRENKVKEGSANKTMV
jgi:choline dehydrogenase-like flavoprotein